MLEIILINIIKVIVIPVVFMTVLDTITFISEGRYDIRVEYPTAITVIIYSLKSILKWFVFAVVLYFMFTGGLKV